MLRQSKFFFFNFRDLFICCKCLIPFSCLGTLISSKSLTTSPFEQPIGTEHVRFQLPSETSLVAQCYLVARRREMKPKRRNGDFLTNARRTHAVIVIPENAELHSLTGSGFLSIMYDTLFSAHLIFTSLLAFNDNFCVRLAWAQRCVAEAFSRVLEFRLTKVDSS